MSVEGVSERLNIAGKKWKRKSMSKYRQRKSARCRI